MNRPLAGTTVLELASRECCESVRVAMRFAGKVALDLGARVIRIEARSRAPAPSSSESALAHFLDEGKHALDLSHDTRVRADSIASLARDSDVVIADDGIDPGDFAAGARQPVVAQLSLFGRAVPTVGNDFTVMAMSGMLDTVGEPAREPLRLGGHQLAYSAGLAAYAGIAAALFAKAARTDARECVRVSLFDTALWINWKNLAAAAYFNRSPSRPGRQAAWQVVRCADGWMALVYVDKDWAALKALIADARLDDARFATEQGRARHAAEIGVVAESAFCGHTRREIERRARELRLPLGAVWTPVELVDDPQYRARGVFACASNGGTALTPRLPVRWQRASEGRAATGDAPVRRGADDGVLRGLRVLDLGILTAGAATSALLADLGADVVKVESRRYGDPFRVWPAGVARDPDPSRLDCPPYFRATNRNKRSICLDLKSARGREAFLRLAARSDVVVENFRRGVLRDLGLAYDALAAVNPRIVLASLSSQGENGPEADRVSFGSTLEATGGLAWITGYAADAPVISGQILNYADQAVSIFGAGMILTALLERAASGAGLHLQVSQRELVTYLIGETFADLEAGRGRVGNAQAQRHVQQCFRASDGHWLAVSVDPDQSSAVGRLVGAGPGWEDAHGLSAAIAAWSSRHPAARSAEALAAFGVAAAVVLDGGQALKGISREVEAMIELPGGALVKGFPFQLDAMPLRVTDDAHAMGQDTSAVLREVAGYSASEVDALVAAGVAGLAAGEPELLRAAGAA